MRLHQKPLNEERQMRKAVGLPIVAVLLAVVLVAGALPQSPVMAQRTEYVFIEAAPGKLASVGQAARAAGAQIRYEFAEMNALAVAIPASAVDKMRHNPNVVAVEPDPERAPAASTMAADDVPSTQVVPWGIEAVQAPQVWAKGYLGEGVNVCVIDTGLYAGHEDLSGLPSIGGFSQVDDNWAYDGYGHGTHVVGTIGAVDNNVGVIGVSPGKVNIFMVKIFDNDGLWVSKAHASDLIAAAQLCGEKGANVISMSLSGTNSSGKERMAFDALYAQGILSVGAASNDGIEEYHYPASYDSVISVAAIDESLTVADFSQFNDQVELAAPGVGVLSTTPWLPNSFLFVGEEEYQAMPMEFSPYGTATGELVDGGFCYKSDPVADWSGKVVLCSRGIVSFAEKVAKVMDNGGAAAVIYNNAEGLFSGTLGEEGDWIVAISISQEDGQAALAYLGQEATVQNEEPVQGNGYEAWNGTSMATPHVSGVAALLWSANPSWTNVQIREAMDATALDLGDPGRDVHYGYGLVQAYDALKYLQHPGKGPKGPKP
jgi:serine protease